MKLVYCSALSFGENGEWSDEERERLAGNGSPFHATNLLVDERRKSGRGCNNLTDREEITPGVLCCTLVHSDAIRRHQPPSARAARPRTTLHSCQGSACCCSNLLRLGPQDLHLCLCNLCLDLCLALCNLCLDLCLALCNLCLLVQAVDVGCGGVAAAVEIEEGAEHSSHAEDAAGADIAGAVGGVDGTLDGT